MYVPPNKYKSVYSFIYIYIVHSVKVLIEAYEC